jgi:hypothetical protein
VLEAALSRQGPADVVETSDANRPVIAETSLETDWRLSLLGPGTP